MAKRILSWVLVCALLMTCFSGIALVTAADELPTPYTWLTVDQTTGEVTASRTAQHSGIDPYVSTQISETEGYGLKLTGDWQGFWIGSDALLGLPEDKSVTLLIEYYVAPDQKLNDQILRFMPAMKFDANGVEQEGEQWIDCFTTTATDAPSNAFTVIEVGKTSVFAYTYPAAQLDALRETAVSIGVKGCYGGTDCAYIKSLKIVDTEYVATAVPYAYFTVDSTVAISDYYPGIEVPARKDMTSRILEVSDTFNGYHYIHVSGAIAGNADDTNKPLYIKLYAKEGFEDATVDIAVDATGYDGNWNHNRGLAFVDGVKTLYVDACLKGRLNYEGSLRIGVDDMAKVERIEVYDVTTYCTEYLADAAVVAEFHEYKKANNYGITVEGAVSSETGASNTGLVVCDACGETLANYEEYYKTPYAWMDTDGGVVTGNRVAQMKDGSALVPEAIGDTGEYGIKLTADWAGFWIGGKMLQEVPEGQSVTMVIEYYTNKEDFKNSNHQMFRYQIADGYAHVDLFIEGAHLVANQSALVYHTFTAEELAALKDSDFRFYVMGCAAGANNTYIQSVRLVNTEFVHPIDTADKGVSVADLKGAAICDYYPEITIPYGINTSWRDLEVSATFEGYTYFRVNGAVAGNADLTNRPIFVKVYAAEGYEYGSVDLGQYDATNAEGTDYIWANAGSVNFEDGEAGIILNACFLNRLNGSGSIRMNVSQAKKIARIEFYDATTYCTADYATEAGKASLHAAMHKAGINVTVEGAVEATDKTVGHTGKATCNLCSTVISEGESYYKDPYGWFDTQNGALQGNRVMGTSGENGTTEVVAIPGTNEYGIPLKGDWQGFWMGGTMLADLPEGQSVTLAIKYYLDAPILEDTQLFRFQAYSGMKGDVLDDGTVTAWDDIFALRNNLVSRKSGLLLYTFTAEDIAAIGTGDFRVTILGCSGGANKVYIQAAKIISSDFIEAVETEEGLTYYDFDGQVISPYFPEVTVRNSNNVTFSDSETHPDHPDRDWLYRYVKVFGDVLAADRLTNKPLYVKIYAKEGFENAEINLGTYEKTDGVVESTWAHDLEGYEAPIVKVENGVGGIYLPAACFNNQLNGVGSLRLWWEEAEKIDRIEFYDVATACNGTMTDGVKEDIHAGMMANNQNVTIEQVEGFTDKVICATCGDVIAGGEAIIECEHTETTIVNDKAPTCGAEGYTGDTVCAACGELIKAGEAIAATGDHAWDDGVVTVAPTYETAGVLTVTCTVCGEFYTEEIPVLVPCDHAETTETRVDATCTVDGSITVTCAACGEVISTEIIKAGHTYTDADDTVCDVCGEDANAAAYTYTIADGAVTIDKVDTSIRGDVVIPSTIEGYPVTEIAINAFKGCTEMTSVTIPESITTIGYYAFRGCTGLTTVYYNAAACTSMGVAAYPVFTECANITTLYIGKSVTTIPAQAFRGIASLTTVYLTKNTAVINRNAFHLCEGITDVYFVGSAGDWTNVDVKSYNTALTNAIFAYNTPCFGEHDWTADCDSLCDLCGEKRDTEHTAIVDDAAVDATCEATGLTAGSHCETCGNVIEAQRVIPALGHTWDAGVVTKEATDEENGTKLYTCTVCGGTKEVVLTQAEIIDGYYYYKGVLKPGAGLVQVEDAYYYVTSSGAVKTGRFTLSASEEFGIEKGAYYFFADGKLNLERGVYEGLYYNDQGKGEAYAGLIEWNGAKYYVNDGGYVETGRYFITKLNGLVPKARAYTFYEDGRMLEEDRIYDVDGFYYEDGLRVPYAGMVEYEGHWYYVSDHGAYVKSKMQILVNVNNSGIAKNARCYFDENGHLVYNTVANGRYFGADGVAPSYAGVVQAADGNLYYVSGTHGALTVGKNVTISAAKTNGLCAAGKYTADANGVLTPAV